MVLLDLLAHGKEFSGFIVNNLNKFITKFILIPSQTIVTIQMFLHLLDHQEH